MLTIVGWVLVFSSITTLVLMMVPRRSGGSRRQPLDLDLCKAGLDDIRARLKLGHLSEAEADAARLALLSRPRPSSASFGQFVRRPAATITVSAAVFLLIAGVGTTVSYVGDQPLASSSGDAIAESPRPPGSDGEMLADLTDYTRSIGATEPVSAAAPGKPLPDVNTMIEQLAARLRSAPEDVKGWRMLGWSYLQMERYDDAAAAYAKALELDPSSAELKRSYEEAKASSNSHAAAGNDVAHEAGTEKIAKSEVTPPLQSNAAIRGMVDGMANRLESSPRDVDGWTSLMRSRVVLGEREAASTAFRKALDVFKDDAAASGKIMAAAVELGLKAQ